VPERFLIARAQPRALTKVSAATGSRSYNRTAELPCPTERGQRQDRGFRERASRQPPPAVLRRRQEPS
jgi:hypothetical protein